MKESFVSLYLGMRGAGKSYLVKEYELKKYKRILIYDTQGEYTDGIVFEELEELKKFWLQHYQGAFKIIYRPLNHVNFSAICDLVYTCGNMCFVVEELDLTAGTFDTDINFQSIIKRGRHKNITFIGISQRPFGINRNITSQAKIIYSFRQLEPRDVEYLKYFIGVEAEQIPNLKKYHFLYWNYNIDIARMMTYNAKTKTIIPVVKIAEKT